MTWADLANQHILFIELILGVVVTMVGFLIYTYNRSFLTHQATVKRAEVQRQWKDPSISLSISTALTSRV